MEAIVTNLTPEDLCFTVEVPQLGPPWDVYRIWREGRRQHLALRVVGDTEADQNLELCFMDTPHVDEEMVRKRLHARAPS